MIERYALPEMAAVWDERVRTAIWAKIEIEAVRARVELGEVPADVLERIEERATVSIERMKEIEQETHHDVIAFLKALAEEIGEDDALHVHVGMTSSDILDTTIGVQIGRSGHLILEKLEELRSAVRERALEHRATPIVGRTHGVHAEPTTLGLKFAYWWDELTRVRTVVGLAVLDAAVGKLSGAVGTYAELDPRIEKHVCEALGIRPAPISSQIVARDRHARYLSALAVLGSVMARQALEIRLLARTETSEILEGFGRKQKGSSAMPHKRNPIKCEQISGLARVLRANAHAAMENIELWHERDISHSSVERVILPDSSILTHYLLDRFTRVVRALDIRPDRMLENIGSSNGLVFSGGVLTALVRGGMSRDEAYDRVQRAAMAARERGVELLETIREDEVIMGALGSGRIERIMSLDPHLRHIGEIFERLGIEEEEEAA
ncbi:MAG: adenylosuccinate lyase [Candidatus Eisenbacteria bacterium]|nr:adenylosuccinate lyase [Candidatus Eisenbacteria bacterium]